MEVLNKSHSSLQMGNRPIPIAEHFGQCIFVFMLLVSFYLFKKLQENDGVNLTHLIPTRRSAEKSWASLDAQQQCQEFDNVTTLDRRDFSPAHTPSYRILSNSCEI